MSNLISIIAFQALVALFLIRRSKERNVFDMYILLLLASMVIHFTSKLVFFLDLLHIPGFYNTPSSFFWVYPPLLFLAAKTLVKKPSPLAIVSHVAPFTAGFMLYAYVLIRLYMSGGTYNYGWYSSIITVAVPVYLLVYPLLTLNLLRKHKEIIGTPEYNLVKTIALVLLLFSALVLLYMPVYYFFEVEFNIRILYALQLVVIFRIITYKLKTNREMVPGSPEIVTAEGSNKKYSSSTLDEVALGQYRKLVLDYFEKEKPYLESELTLTQLANRLGIPKHHLTQVLNTQFGKNFYLFINEYRIQAVIDRMLSSDNSESIIDIAFGCGFNSKSTFNTYFKKVTGTTPSSFKGGQLAR